MEEKMKYNYGRLRDNVELQNNIIYYKRGDTEMSINVTNKCPNNCCFCIRDRKVGWSDSNLYLDKEPSLKEIKKELLNALEINPKIKKIKICGYGEPLLRVSLLPNIISLIKKKRPEILIQLATSGWPIYNTKKGETYFKKSVEKGLDIVYLGLHAINFKDYKKIVNPNISSKKAFDQTIKFIKMAVALNLKVTCAFVDLNNLSIEDIKKFTKKLNCKYEIRSFEK